MKEPIITILTDFGDRDPYVGAIKGVILSICPIVKIIDLSHSIQKHNIDEGAFFILSVAKYYPKNSIHLVVIDPGVGSDRKSIIIQSENYLFVGPDNGVMSLAAESDKIQKVIEITNTAYFLDEISNTFHGRDIFAPVAAHLANNTSLEKFGRIIQTWIQLEIPKPKTEKSEIHAEIIHIDRFGNLITNISRDIFQNLKGFQKEFIRVKIKKQELQIPLCKSYNQVKIGEFLGIFGSYNLLEISKNQDSAGSSLNIQKHEKISIKF